MKPVRPIASPSKSIANKGSCAYLVVISSFFSLEASALAKPIELLCTDRYSTTNYETKDTGKRTKKTTEHNPDIHPVYLDTEQGVGSLRFLPLARLKLTAATISLTHSLKEASSVHFEKGKRTTETTISSIDIDRYTLNYSYSYTSQRKTFYNNLVFLNATREELSRASVPVQAVFEQNIYRKASGACTKKTRQI